MEAIRSSETSALTRATLRHILEDGTFHSHRRENLKSYNHLNVQKVLGKKETNKQTLWPLACKRSIPTERPPLVGQI
jgi:hypothetical protein